MYVRLKNKTITDSLYSHFVHIDSALANKFPENSQLQIDKTWSCIIDNIIIGPVIENEVQLLIRNLKHSNAGWDSIVAVVLNVPTEQFSSHSEGIR